MAKKAESTLKTMLLSLTIIAIVAAAALAFVNAVTAEPIAQAQKAKEEAAMKAVLPMAETFEATEIENCTRGLDAQGAFVGKAIKAKSDKGFGGALVAMVGLDADGNIAGYQILETAETPGLGAKADKWFQKDGKGNVIGKSPAARLMVKKDGGDVDAISGSTITSRAFCDLINNAYEIFQKGGNE